jgi:uncharacterized protein YcbX
MTADLGTVAALSRFPVKSMQGEHPTIASLDRAGVGGDRAFALVAQDSGKVLSAKHPRVGTKLLACRAEYTGAFEPGAPTPPVRITLPDGRTVESGDDDADAALSGYLEMAVALQSKAADGYAMDVYHPDIEGLGPDELRDQVTESVGGAAIFNELGVRSPIPPDSFLDAFPVSLITTATLDRLHALAPKSRFDPRRFRMNLVVETDGEGFVEQDWLGRTVGIGSARIRVVVPDPRCVMTTLAQDGLPRDPAILRTLARHNALEVAGQRSPCAGVYAVVESPGSVEPGDRLVEL